MGGALSRRCPLLGHQLSCLDINRRAITTHVSEATQAEGEAFARQVLHVIGLLDAGEWSSFGAVSGALRGNTASSRAVGNVIRTYGGQPHSRLLRKNGTPSQQYLPEPTSVSGVTQTTDPELQRHRLEKDGLPFIKGRADPSRYVSTDKLRERLRKKPLPGT
jgi:alkylated DNA nucleotide flippase Atl1